MWNRRLFVIEFDHSEGGEPHVFEDTQCNWQSADWWAAAGHDTDEDEVVHEIERDIEVEYTNDHGDVHEGMLSRMMVSFPTFSTFSL